jgi:sugar lactone lactonase YvrE
MPGMSKNKRHCSAPDPKTVHDRFASYATMKTALWAGLAIALPLIYCQAAFGQSPIVTTHAGPPLPIAGMDAVTQTIDLPSAVVSNGAGGFYVASVPQSKVYSVAANGTLGIVVGGLASPQAMAVDAAGNLFISDTNNNRILKVTAGGEIRTIAGTGASAFGGDGGVATSASFYAPTGLAIDSGGNLFVADTGNNRIRKITPGGLVTTVAGNGSAGSGGNGGPATEAQLIAPCGVAVDSNGLLFAVDRNRIRKIFTPTESLVAIITTIAGSEEAGYQGDGGPAVSALFNGPCGITFDSSGNLFIADSFNNRIRMINSAGIITSVAGDGTFGYAGDGGPAVAAKLNRPYTVALDAANNLLIADTYNHRVRKTLLGGTISTAAGNGRDGFGGDGGNAAFARFSGVEGIAVDNAGNVFIADRDNNRIRKVTAAGIVSTIAGNGTAGFGGDGGMATAAQLNSPKAVAVDGAGNIYIADWLNQRIRKVTAAGIISTVVGDGTPGFSGDGDLATGARINHPSGLAVDA